MPCASLRRRTPSRIARWSWIKTCRAILLSTLGWHAALVLALSPPDMLLFDASLGEARSFTVESAADRGWTIRSVAPTQAIFEQTLVGSEDQGILTIEQLLRIFAEFREESTGVRVYLRAQEVDWPETDEERMTDVTDRYRDNLMRALASLRAKWDAQREGDGIAPPAGTRDPGRVVSAAPLRSGASGVWSYAAEHYAISRGCELTDRPTQLMASGPDWERHGVFCADGTQVGVECRHGDCTSSR
ncbi:hypothetical protein [Imhoffiella purpurea]|nr:hypothetical protein [Imhoffiella purpurea]